MSKPKNTGRKYEAEIKEVFEAVHALERIEHTEIQLNRKLDGNTKKRDGQSIEHEIDATWQTLPSGTLNIVQAKDYANERVKKLEMMGFDQTINDVNATKGIFVSHAGYQAGALEWAYAAGIEANELRNPTKEELANRIQYLRTDLQAIPQFFMSVSDFIISQEWLDSLTSQQKFIVSKPIALLSSLTMVRKTGAAEQFPIALFGLREKKSSTDFEGMYEVKLAFALPFEITNPLLPFPILAYGFTYHLMVGSPEYSTIALDAELVRILRNVTGGQSYMIANVNGEQRAIKVCDLPPTKFTPAANPRKTKR